MRQVMSKQLDDSRLRIKSILGAEDAFSVAKHSLAVTRCAAFSYKEK